ncbi:MAG: TIGR02206 family membrane protein, partial [Betaproteobacteria bacterium]|nr:TIGR02206 family membrane protein [Betaproteobacteria bacterium]
MDVFEPFTPIHALAFAGVAAAAWLFAAVGRRTPAPTSLERGFAIANLAIWIAAHGWWILPPQLDPATTLPLQLCHITAVVASLVLLTRRHALRVLLYFWGFALSTQAILTPTLTDPPTSLWFWAFWAQHGFVLVVAVYDFAVLGFRPAWRDYWFACRMTFLYGLAMLPVNLTLGANYGFVGN